MEKMLCRKVACAEVNAILQKRPIFFSLFAIAEIRIDSDINIANNEIGTALLKMNNERSPDHGNIPTEVAGGRILVETITLLKLLLATS